MPSLWKRGHFGQGWCVMWLFKTLNVLNLSAIAGVAGVVWFLWIDGQNAKEELSYLTAKMEVTEAALQQLLSAKEVEREAIDRLALQLDGLERDKTAIRKRVIVQSNPSDDAEIAPVLRDALKELEKRREGSTTTTP